MRNHRVVANSGPHMSLVIPDMQISHFAEALFFRPEQKICAPLTISHQLFNAARNHTVAIQVHGVRTLLKTDSLWGITLDSWELSFRVHSDSLSEFDFQLWRKVFWYRLFSSIFGEDALENELYPAWVDITLENKLPNEHHHHPLNEMVLQF